jgi:hypothetical protein
MVAVTGHRGRRDDDVGVGDFTQQRRLLGLALVVGQFARVAPRRVRGDAELHEDRARGFGLFLRGAAHVVGSDLRAETLRGGDCLETRDAHAHDQNLRRSNRPRGRRQQRKEAVEVARPG